MTKQEAKRSRSQVSGAGSTLSKCSHPASDPPGLNIFDLQGPRLAGGKCVGGLRNSAPHPEDEQHKGDQTAGEHSTISGEKKTSRETNCL